MGISKKVKIMNFINMGAYSLIAFCITKSLPSDNAYNNMVGIGILILSGLMFVNELNKKIKLKDNNKNLMLNKIGPVNSITSLINGFLFINEINKIKDNEIKKAKILFTSLWLNAKQTNSNILISDLLENKITEVIKNIFTGSEYSNFFSKFGYTAINEKYFNEIIINKETKKEYHKIFNDSSILIDSINYESQFNFILKMQDYKLTKADVIYLQNMNDGFLKNEWGVEIKNEAEEDIKKIIINNMENIELIKKMLNIFVKKASQETKDKISNLNNFIEKTKLMTNLSNNLIINNENINKKSNKI